MNRRGFLQNAMLAAAALVVDPEKLLWTPGQKRIFIPPAKPVFLTNHTGRWLIGVVRFDSGDGNVRRYQFDWLPNVSFEEAYATRFPEAHADETQSDYVEAKFQFEALMNRP